MPSPDGPHRANRDALIGAILEFCASEDLLTVADIQSALECEIAAAGTEALVTLKARLAADNGWAYYPPDPLARRIHHLLADPVPRSGFRAGGFTARAARVQRAGRHPGQPCVVCRCERHRDPAATHRSRCARGSSDRSGRPKVFTSRQRRFSSLCFGTVKVPQSTEVSSEEAVLIRQEVARAARRSIDVARERLLAGDALLLFGEGTRSRTGAMQPMLTGVARYLDVPGAWVLPAGVAGSERLFPVDASRVRPGRATVHLGEPIQAQTLLTRAGGDRRVAMDAIGLAVARLLPAAYRGVYAHADHFPAATELLRHSMSPG